MGVTSSMTATSRVSFDTNILIYSIDLRDMDKHAIARKIVRRCGEINGVISLQCLSEFYRATTKKQLLPAGLARDIVEETRAAIDVVAPIEADLLRAIELHQTHKQQFFDALMRATVERAGGATLFSEDMGHGTKLGRLTVLNPFLLSAEELERALA